MLDSLVNSVGEEILEDDDEGCVDGDGYSMEELLNGEIFEYIDCPINVSGVQNGTHIMYVFTTGWERGTIQP